MSTTALWFAVVLSYVIQTRGFSHIQSRTFLSNLKAPAKATADAAAQAAQAAQESYGTKTLTVYLTFIYFASWLLVLPLSRLWKDDAKPLLPLENSIASNSSLSLDHDEDDEIDNVIDTVTVDNLLENEGKQEEFSLLSVATAKYVAKLSILAVLAVVNIFTYNMALSLSPAFDVALIENTSIFEIVTLLYGVCNISRKNYVFRNFFVMMVALIGILIVSYTKATCDLLAGKLSINQDTGEVNDPFLFDRLKGGLICGLGALTMGPFAVLWNRWFTAKGAMRTTLAQQSQHLGLIGCISMLMLLPFLPALSTSNDYISLLYTDKSFWLTIMGSIIFGILPNLLSLIQLNRTAPPEYITTCFLGIIIFMGLADWVTEPTQTMIVRWEVIGYLMLAISCVTLSYTLGERKKKFSLSL